MAVTIVLTNSGEEWVAERIAGVQGAGTNNVAANAGSHIGIGTGSHTAAKSDTALTTEVETRSVCSAATVTGTGSSAKYSVTGPAITAASVRILMEAGLFSALTTGIMFISTTFNNTTTTDSVTLQVGDTIALTFTLDPA